MKQQQAQPVAPNPDKSRNVFGGFNMWAQSFPFINFIMFILGWFTVPIEVLFRRNFGERWLTVINFYAGLLVLGGFNFLQMLAGASYDASFYQRQPVGGNAEPSFWESLMNRSMLLILLAYLIISSYHFFRMWWRNRTNTALHSFDDGTSRFEPVAIYLMKVVNIIAVPVIRIYMLLLPKHEQEKNIEAPSLVVDVTAFTNTIFEPLLLLILSLLFAGVTRTWLLISVPALAVYAAWKETAKLNKVLDFRDTVIEAEAMANFKHSPELPTTENQILQQAAETIKNNPEVAPKVNQRYPDLMSIIEEMNSDKSAVE